MNVLKAYQSLDTEQKQILASKQVDLNRPIDDVLALLKPLATCDTVADKARTKVGCSFGIGIVLSIVLAIVFSNIGWTAVRVVFIFMIVAIVAGAGYLYFWTKKIDLSNNFRQFTLPVLAVLREDIDATHPMHLRMNLGSPTSKEKKTSESAPYAAGVYHKVIDCLYVDAWMTATAVLVDGTKLSWSVTDHVRERKKTKRNARGKYKTKTKYTKKTDIEVEVALRKKTYEMTAPAEGEVTSDGKRNKVRMERQVRTDSLDPLDPRALIDAVADVYRNTRQPVKEAGA